AIAARQLAVRAERARDEIAREAPLRARLRRDLQRQRPRAAAQPRGGHTPNPNVIVKPMADSEQGTEKEKPNPYDVALAQLDKAARVAGISPAVRDILSQPKNELIVNFPVRM